MRAIRVIDGAPTLVDAEPVRPAGDEVRVRVASVGICGSDLHLIDMGMAEGRVLGHEIAGHLDDGRAVAIEPFRSCGRCRPCVDGERHRCAEGIDILGIVSDGGMAEEMSVPAAALVALPGGVDVGDASLVENLAVAVHALNRARLDERDRVAVIGAGPIGLATTAALRRHGFAVAVSARHDHQRVAATALGATLIDDDPAAPADGFDVVFDAVGSTASLRDAARRLRQAGRICVVGSWWEPVQVDIAINMKEAEVIPAMMYGRTPNGREIDGAASLIAELPHLGDHLITHRFPLEAAPEAFATARDRASGALKVVFEPGR